MNSQRNEALKNMVCSTFMSPVGKIFLVSDRNALVGLWLEGQKHFPKNINEITTDDRLEIFKETKRWLEAYFKGNNPEITVKLAPRGTEFQQKVWRELRGIPYGKTVTYGDIAKRIGTKSARAVGGAVGRNPISIIIPCHRVMGKNNALTGYDGGIDKKLILLKLEKSVSQS